jgi:hypothetical protein
MQIRRVALALALVLTVAGALSAFVSPSARAADQTVRGKTFVVKDPKPGVDASLRSVVVLGKELPNDDSVIGDPIANGATVEIIANGASSTAQVFPLPPGASMAGSPGWKALGSPVIGYSYKDAGGVNGPVKAALIKESGNGMFIVKVTIKGALGPGPQPHITVVPPAPGTDGGMRFSITAGDSYCVLFGGAAGGVVTNAPTSGSPNKTFKIVTPTAEAGCPVLQVNTTSTTTSSTTTTSATTTSTTLCTPMGVVLKGSLTATGGRFNYNLTLGLPGANSACNTNFPGTHACTYSELQAAQTACNLPGLKDTSLMTVTSFWAIDGTQPILQQCNDDAPVTGSGLNWEYGTAHTLSRGQRVALNNAAGTLGVLQTSVQCNIAGTSWVGCCQ